MAPSFHPSLNSCGVTFLAFGGSFLWYLPSEQTLTKLVKQSWLGRDCFTALKLLTMLRDSNETGEAEVEKRRSRQYEGPQFKVLATL